VRRRSTTWPTTQLADEVEFTGAMTRAEHEARVEEFNATARPTW
jgi:hypothetical protein